MGWIRDGMEDHEGFVVMVVRDGWQWRELGLGDRVIPTDEHGYKVQHRLQIGCECGWRSERFVAPLGTDWAPCSVILPDEETENAAALYWSEMHMDRLSESAPGTLFPLPGRLRLLAELLDEYAACAGGVGVRRLPENASEPPPTRSRGGRGSFGSNP